MRIHSCAKKIQRAFRVSLKGKRTQAVVKVQRYWRYKLSNQQSPSVKQPFKSINQLGQFLSTLRDTRKETVLQKVRRKVAVVKI